MTPVPRFVDLHVHSTASDGAFAPAAVVAAASDAGVSALALTDHDTLGGLAEATSAGTELGVRIVTGVELSTVEGGAEIHLLGLHLSRLGELERHLLTFRTARRTRAERIVQRLNEIGVAVSLDSVLEIADGAAIGRPHIARAMIASGWAHDFRDAFDRYLGNGRPAFVAKYALPLADGVQLVHRSGGLAIVAHPGPIGTRRRVEAWIALGVDGIEIRHPGHGAEDTARLQALADHFGLVPSGGSDWHGAMEGARVIGGMRVPQEWLERQEARLRDRMARGLVA